MTGLDEKPITVGGIVTNDAPGEFHRQKGCCDGSDPSGCWQRQQDEKKEADRLAKEARRVARSGPAGEYEGTGR